VIATYIFVDEAGNPLYKYDRFQDKSFRAYRCENAEYKLGLRDTRIVLYNLPDVIAADVVDHH
jgi:hypothetical protein